MDDAPAPRPAGVWSVIKKRWRGWLRSIHRDIGYLAVGFTLIYALSGIAINHISDWDPNFTSYERERTIDPVAAELPDDAAQAQILASLGLGAPRETYRAGDEFHLTYDDKKVVIYGDTGLVIEQGRQERFLLRIANWLHYNRGKQAWTLVADLYAVMLLYLAISGIFMIKGKLGLRWRGAVLVSLGLAVPIVYVVLSGGPNARTAAEPAPASEDSMSNPSGRDT
jgi:hypothetical protein